MIKYRPHRATLQDAMKEAREFENYDELKRFVVDEWTRKSDWIGEPPYLYCTEPPFAESDIVIGDVLGDDDRIGWKNVRHVCTKRYGSKDYMKLYGCPQCIGMCGE